jgi:hypothetical protein
MSEHWKSTPKYWCKHCSCYVRDTKLERQNHESTAKHQGALKRFLRDLHRGHEREEREKDRARQEIARVSGVVTGSSSSSSTTNPSLRSTGAQPSQTTASSEAQLKKQREQLAEMGVAMPSDFRPEMAMPGEWTVTSTRVIKDKKDEPEVKVEATASGIRKREETEEQQEEEEAMRGLFKRPRKWGRDTKVMPGGEDKDLDALLSGSLLSRKAPDEDDGVKPEPADAPEGEIKKETEEAASIDPAVKVEPQESTSAIKSEDPENEPLVKPETTEDVAAPVVFKKRKPKGMRQK